MFKEKLAGKAVLVTGGSSGIGLAVSTMLRECGATVGVFSNDRGQLDRMGPGFFCYCGDIRDGRAVREAADAFARRAGKIDGLVNCAGASRWCGLMAMSEEFWDLIYDVNVKGTFLAIQAVARHMIERKAGIIVNVASMSALKSGMPDASAYASSKWAIVGLSRNLHLELKPHGIRVGCLCPGSTRTPLHEAAGSPNIDEMLDPRDVARAVLFMLAAPPNGHVQLLAMPAMFEEWR
ncbi:MAG: SDR family oxidoreductase [Planctomycetes bacterium]|nr:SDR family oxidoreductase [Planctomycetota bacterium]